MSRKLGRDVPDWRNPEKYPDPKLAPPERWAWEFLRRNPEYQADYLRLREERPFYAVAANDIPYAELGLKVPANPDENREALTRGTSRLARELEQKWGVKPIASPAAAHAWKWLRVESVAVGPHLTPRRNEEMLVRIDLAGSIKDQLDAAKPLLQLCRDILKVKTYGERARMDKWAVYLWLLDARQETHPPSWVKLAGALSNESPEGWSAKRAKDAYDAACVLRDTGWRFIALKKEK